MKKDITNTTQKSRQFLLLKFSKRKQNCLGTPFNAILGGKT